MSKLSTTQLWRLTEALEILERLAHDLHEDEYTAITEPIEKLLIENGVNLNEDDF